MLKKHSKKIITVIVLILLSIMFDIKVYIGGEKFNFDYVVRKVENFDTSKVRENLKRAIDRLTRKL